MYSPMLVISHLVVTSGMMNIRRPTYATAPHGVGLFKPETNFPGVKKWGVRSTSLVLREWGFGR